MPDDLQPSSRASSRKGTEKQIAQASDWVSGAVGELQPRSRPSSHTGRLPCNNYAIDLVQVNPKTGEEHLRPMVVSFAYDLKGTLREVVFEGRGKIGEGIDLMFHDLSIKLSRILQDRDPATGEIDPRLMVQIPLDDNV